MGAVKRGYGVDANGKAYTEIAKARSWREAVGGRPLDFVDAYEEDSLGALSQRWELGDNQRNSEVYSATTYGVGEDSAHARHVAVHRLCAVAYGGHRPNIPLTACAWNVRGGIASADPIDPHGADLTQQLIRNDGFAVIFFEAIVRKMLKGVYQVG